MNVSLNQVTIAGNLGQDADIRFTQSGVAVANFSVATSEKWKDGQGQWQESTEWHKVVCWRPSDYVQGKLRKGCPVLIEGKLATRKYDKDGETRYITEIQARRVQPLVEKDVAATENPYRVPEAEARGQSQPARNTASQQSSLPDPFSGDGISDDDIPF